MFNHSSIKMDPYTTRWKSTIKVGFMLWTLPFGYLSHRSSDKSRHENRRWCVTENVEYLMIFVGIIDICQRVKSLLHRFLSRCNVHQILVVVSSAAGGTAWLSLAEKYALRRCMQTSDRLEEIAIWAHLDIFGLCDCYCMYLALIGIVSQLDVLLRHDCSPLFSCFIGKPTWQVTTRLIE